jgi:hypothetical protein
MMTATAFPQDAFDVLDPAAIERGIRFFMTAYQQSRSAMLAWFVVRYAQALCRHPDFEGSDEERCAWRRVARQWRLLAGSLPTSADQSDRPPV